MRCLLIFVVRNSCLKKVISNIRLPWLLFTLLVFAALVKLGMWQSNRAVEKEVRLSNIAKVSKASAMSLSDIQKLPINKVNDLPIKLTGEFEQEVVFLLDNQVEKGKLGYRVYQIFNVDEYALLINLGWVLGSVSRSELPKVKAIQGAFEFNGNVRVIEKGILLMEQEFNDVVWPLRVQQIELDKFSAITNKPLLPFVVYVNKDDPLGYTKNWQPIVMPPEKHRAYAFQWFSLALAWLILMIWASIKFGKTEEDKH